MKHVGMEWRREDDLYVVVPEVQRRLVAEMNVSVPEDKIRHVVYQLYEGYRPPVGSVYSRYHFVKDEVPLVELVFNTIALAVNTDLRSEENANKLDIWDSRLGTFNRHGLLAHPPIKTLRNHIPRGLFHMTS